MPPKPDKGQQKAEAKAKQKIVEDKTFGLKNKNKSKTVQKYIKSVQAQVTGGRVKSEHELKAEQKEKVDERKKVKAQQALLSSLQKAQDALKGAASNKTDNKAISEAQKVNIYVDPRTEKQEGMSEWDQSKLEQVVKTKHGGQKCQSEIVCKYFLDALEKRQYGWFWQCPNGETCHYRHALPPGYVLKRRDIGEIIEDPESTEPIEEILERERQALPPGGTPVTLETFLAWKAKKDAEEAAAKEAAQKKREKETGRLEMSGRDLFVFNKDVFTDAMGGQDDDEEDEFAHLLAERKVADVEEERLMQEQAAANLAAASVGDPLPDVADDNTTASQPQPIVHNKDLFTAQAVADAGQDDPDELDD